MPDQRPAIRFPFQDAFERFWINPVTSWERFFNPQFFITYNANDVAVENHVLSRVGSYGKQLGRLIDVLDVLVGQVRPEELTPRERQVLAEFRTLSRRVEAAVADVRGPEDGGLTATDVDRVLAGLEQLARTDPAGHQRLMARLRDGLAEQATSTESG